MFHLGSDEQTEITGAQAHFISQMTQHTTEQNIDTASCRHWNKCQQCLLVLAIFASGFYLHITIVQVMAVIQIQRHHLLIYKFCNPSWEPQKLGRGGRLRIFNKMKLSIKLNKIRSLPNGNERKSPLSKIPHPISLEQTGLTG